MLYEVITQVTARAHMEIILQAMSQGQTQEGLPHLTALLDTIRPARPSDNNRAIDNLRKLSQLLENHPAYRAALRNQLGNLLSNCTQVRLYSDTGILANEGFFSTIKRRLGYRRITSYNVCYTKLLRTRGIYIPYCCLLRIFVD